MGRSPERINPNGQKTFEEAFGVNTREVINHEIEKILPDFKEDGLKREEMDLIRATFYHRILLNGGMSALMRGKQKTSGVFKGLLSRVEHFQGDLFNKLAIKENGERRLPPKLEKKVHRVVNMWTGNN